MSTRRRPLALHTALTAALLVLCGPVVEAASKSLYERLGGAATVQAIADDVVDRAAHDPQLKRSYDKVNLARVKRLLAEQICSLTGGGCTYTEDSMREVHAGMGITEAEFYRLVEVLRDSMRRHGVGLQARNELLRILAPMKRDIVER